MRNHLLIIIALIFLATTARAADKGLALVDVVVGYSSSDDDTNFCIHTQNSATNSYFCGLSSSKNEPAAAYYMAHNLVQNVVKKYYDNGNWHDALKQGLVTTNQNFCAMFSRDESAHGTIVRICNNKVIVAHVGDQTAILIKRKKSLLLTSSKKKNTDVVAVEPSIQVVPIRGCELCLVMATAEYWQRRDTDKTADFCLNYLEGLSMNTFTDMQSYATEIARGLVNSVIRNLNEDKKLAIRVLVLLIKST